MEKRVGIVLVTLPARSFFVVKIASEGCVAAVQKLRSPGDWGVSLNKRLGLYG